MYAPPLSAVNRHRECVMGLHIFGTTSFAFRSFRKIVFLVDLIFPALMGGRRDFSLYASASGFSGIISG